MEPTARHGPGQTVGLGQGTGTKQLVFGSVSLSKLSGRRKVDADKVVRVTVVVSRGRDATIRRLADERFASNMSAAASWAIGLAAAALDGPLAGLQVPANPADVLRAGKVTKP